MTNFSPSYALECACAIVLAAVLGGCAPDDGASEYDRGITAYGAGDLRNAEKFFEKSVKCAPTDVDRLIMLARVKLDLGELDAANEMVMKAATTAGGDSDVIMLGAQIAWHMKDYVKAADGFSSAADNEKFDATTRSEGLSGLGIVEMACDNPNPHLARIAFLKAIRLDRRNAAAWYHLGMLYRDGFGYPEAALEQFDIFVRLEASASPRVQKVQRTIIPALRETIARIATDRPGVSKRDSAASAAAITKAEAGWKKGAYRTARSRYAEALAADPLSYPAAVGLAKAWLKTDRTKTGQVKAFENYKTACTLRPGAISTFLTAGSLAQQLGYHAQAVEIYSRAVAASPTSIEAIDRLVRSLRRVGNKTSIANAYQAYRDLIKPMKTR